MARGLRLARDYHYARVGILVNAKDSAPLVGKVIEGAILGAYTFDKYRQEKDEFLAKEVQLTVFVHPDHRADAEARKARYAWVSENVNRCRDLINEPGAAVTPEVIAEKAGDIAKELGLEIEILDPAGLLARGYHGIVQVGQGSIHAPRMVILRHVPRQPSKETIALVGKGITFDSGGISLKPGDHMWEMKGDMAGAAAVLYAMRAIGRLKPDVRVIGILCCAENMPDARAQRPGDIFTAKNGKSIMVDNTDAEGRLVLTDGLFRAGEEGATHIVDIATLTGAVLRALGPSVAGRARHRPRAHPADHPLGREPRRVVLGAAPRRGVQGLAQDPVRRPQQHLRGRPGRGHHRRPLPARVRARGRGLGPSRHRGADVPRQGLEVLRGRGHRLRPQDHGRPLRTVP